MFEIYNSSYMHIGFIFQIDTLSGSSPSPSLNFGSFSRRALRAQTITLFSLKVDVVDAHATIQTRMDPSNDMGAAGAAKREELCVQVGCKEWVKSFTRMGCFRQFRHLLKQQRAWDFKPLQASLNYILRVFEPRC